MGALLGRSPLLLGKVPPEPATGNVTGFVSAFLPATRAEALARLEAFLPEMADYAMTRNQVLPGHGNVSRLSPATRTRVLLEREILEFATGRHGPDRIEKFRQEVWWRLYWKGWLELRPAVWTGYREALDRLEWSDRARDVISGKSGVAIIDHFTRELLTTGYLHNHARMWWAAHWIHGEGLPWQLGAEFFLRHLLDGDAASNTLSWRWVAGLHTRSKTYLARRSNLERYLDPAILAAYGDGLDRLETPCPVELPWENPPVPKALRLEFPLPGNRTGIWLHDEDLHIEDSPLATLRPAALLATVPSGPWRRASWFPDKTRFLRRAIEDGAGRASRHFEIEAEVMEVEDLAGELASRAEEQRLDTIIALRPFVGPLADELPALASALEGRGIRLQLVRRPEDVSVMNLATGGFFGFWETVKDPARKAGEVGG